MQIEARRELSPFVVERRRVKRRVHLIDVTRSVCLCCAGVKFKLLIAAIRSARHLRIYCAPRFSSSFKMMDSAISFIDLRICWLCFCSVR